MPGLLLVPGCSVSGLAWFLAMVRGCSVFLRAAGVASCWLAVDSRFACAWFEWFEVVEAGSQLSCDWFAVDSRVARDWFAASS